jgi:hypothetical protein
MQQLKENGRVRNLEFVFRNRYGDLVTTLLSADIIKVEGEDCLLCVVKDFTERKRIEHDLILSEQRFNKAFNFSPVTMSITTLEEGRFVDVNESFCQVLVIPDHFFSVGLLSILASGSIRNNVKRSNASSKKVVPCGRWKFTSAGKTVRTGWDFILPKELNWMRNLYPEPVH